MTTWMYEIRTLIEKYVITELDEIQWA